LKGTKYNNITAFDIALSIYSYYEDKDITSTETVFVIEEDDTLKAYKIFNEVDIANNLFCRRYV